MKEAQSKSCFINAINLFGDALSDARKTIFFSKPSMLWSSKDLSKAFFKPGAS